MFFIRSENDPSYLVMYIDDLLTLGSETAVTKVKKQLAQLFRETELGTCSYSLGIKFDRTESSLIVPNKDFSYPWNRIHARLYGAPICCTASPLGHTYLCPIRYITNVVLCRSGR